MKRLALILVVLGVAAAASVSAAAAAAEQPEKQIYTNAFVGPTGETVAGELGAVAW